MFSPSKKMGKGESLKRVYSKLLVTSPVTSLGPVDLFADHTGSQATRRVLIFSFPQALQSQALTLPQGNLKGYHLVQPYQVYSSAKKNLSFFSLLQQALKIIHLSDSQI